MKITDAWIYDPSRSGEIATPELCVQVDEMPGVTIAPESFVPGWRVGKYGPFVKYEKIDGSKVSAVDFNMAFRDRLPMVIDIVLIVDDGESDIVEVPLSLPLARARQLVKKYDHDWRLLVSDREAIHGNLVWRPVETNPECRGDNGLCKARPAGPVRVKGIDIPLCQEHTRLHNQAQAQARALSSSK
jgi:hypothetical protein